MNLALSSAEAPLCSWTMTTSVSYISMCLVFESDTVWALTVLGRHIGGDSNEVEASSQRHSSYHSRVPTPLMCATRHTWVYLRQLNKGHTSSLYILVLVIGRSVCFLDLSQRRFNTLWRRSTLKVLHVGNSMHHLVQ